MDKGEQRVRDAARMEPMIGEDTPCRGCGYNLKGLVVTGKCPECGRSIRKRRKVKQGDCMMTAAPKAWLNVYAVGTTLAFIAWPAMICGAILRCITGSREVGLLAFAAGCVWWVAVVITTRPRPEMPDMLTSPAREWFWQRALARILSAAVAVPLGVLVATSDGASPVRGLPSDQLWLLADAGLLAAAVGFLAFALYMYELAHWAGDHQATPMWRAAGVSMILASLLVIGGRNVGITEGITADFAAIPGGVMFVVFFLAFVGTPVVFSLWALNHQRATAVWAIANHDEAAEKVARDRERLERERAEAIAAGPPDIVAHVDLPNVASSKKARYNPKTMTPGPAPKRVKFTDPEFGGDPQGEVAYALDPEGTAAPAPAPGKGQRTRHNPGLLYNPRTMTPGPAPKRVTNFDPPLDPGDEQAFELSPEPEKPV